MLTERRCGTRSLGHRPYQIPLSPELHDAVVGHGLERAREVAGFAPRRLGLSRYGFRFRFQDDMQQRAVVVTQHLGQRFMEVNQTLGSFGFGL